VKRFHYGKQTTSCAPILADFHGQPTNFARRLKTLNGLTALRIHLQNLNIRSQKRFILDPGPTRCQD